MSNLLSRSAADHQLFYLVFFKYLVNSEKTIIFLVVRMYRISANCGLEKSNPDAAKNRSGGDEAFQFSTDVSNGVSRLLATR